MTGSKTVTVVSIVALVVIAAPAAPQAPDGPVPAQHVSGKSRAEPPTKATHMRETAATRPWTDRLRAGAASIRAIHFLELRTRINNDTQQLSKTTGIDFLRLYNYWRRLFQFQRKRWIDPNTQKVSTGHSLPCCARQKRCIGQAVGATGFCGT